MPNVTVGPALSLAFALVLAAGNMWAFSPAQAAQQAVPTEHNPPGDIPDTQV